MKDAPTLAAGFLRESFKPYYKRQIDPAAKLPWMVANAHRFVLDDTMSAFMADLAWASLLTTTRGPEASEYKAHLLLDGMRMLARLPYKLTWIEYNSKAKARRARGEYGSPVDPEKSPERTAWLCWQDEKVDTAFGAIEFVSHVVPQGKQEPTLYQPQPNAFAYGWMTDDRALPWVSHIDIKDFEGEFRHASEILTGVAGYKSAMCGIIPSPAGNLVLKQQIKGGQFNIAMEVAGDLRYLWALLATINDLPVSFTDVRASKGYVARGRYRKYLDHRTITLNVPTKRFKRIAGRAIAISRRKGHEVRGHWREYNQGDPGHLHTWASTSHNHMGCECGAARVWIAEHQRGDASLGWVSTKHVVTHNADGSTAKDGPTKGGTLVLQNHP